MPITAKSTGPSKNLAICLGGCALTSLLCVLYFKVNGSALQVNYGDSWIFTDLAKRIFFNHSLGMEATFDLIYPPLYPALISVAYFFKSQTSIFNAILTLNILAYSSAFIPVYLLLKDYAQVNRTQAFCGAVLSVINPWSLTYVVKVLSEPLYYPLAAWFTWLLIDGAYLRGKSGLAAFILVFTALPLTKALGNMIFPAFLLFSAAIYYLAARPRPIKLISRPLLVVFISAFFVYLYKRYQFSVLPHGLDSTGGYLPYLDHPNLLKLSYWIERTRLDLSWLIRGTKIAALPLLMALIFRNRELICKDPLVIFAALVFAGTFLVVPLFTPADPLSWEHPRYYAPFVFVLIPVLFKCCRVLNGRDLLAAAGLLSAGILIGLPPTSLREPVRWSIVAYYSLFFGALFYWRKAFVNAFLVLMCAAVMIHVRGARAQLSEADGVVAGFYDQRGITEKILEVRRTSPAAPVLVDNSWNVQNGVNDDAWTEYRMLMIHMPFLPSFVDIRGELSKGKDPQKISLLLTHQPIRNAVKMVQGKYVSLYRLGS